MIDKFNYCFIQTTGCKRNSYSITSWKMPRVHLILSDVTENIWSLLFIFPLSKKCYLFSLKQKIKIFNRKLSITLVFPTKFNIILKIFSPKSYFQVFKNAYQIEIKDEKRIFVCCKEIASAAFFYLHKLCKILLFPTRAKHSQECFFASFYVGILFHVYVCFVLKILFSRL